MSSLGEDLRALREQQALSIEEISKRTRISKRYLEYIEGNRFELLPGGLFNRAFIRSYAQFLGMNPQEAIRRYRSNEPMRREKGRRAEPTLYRHGPFLRFLLSTGVTLTLLILGVFFLYREISFKRSQIEEAKTTLASMPDLSL